MYLILSHLMSNLILCYQGSDENSGWRIQGGRSPIMKNFVVHAEFTFYVSAMRRAFEPDQAVHKGF